MHRQVPLLGLPLSRGTGYNTVETLGARASCSQPDAFGPESSAASWTSEARHGRRTLVCAARSLWRELVSGAAPLAFGSRVRPQGSSVQAQTGAHRAHRWSLSPPSCPHILWQAGRGQYPGCGRGGGDAAARRHMCELDGMVWTKAANHQRCDRSTGTTMHPIKNINMHLKILLYSHNYSIA